jgi:HD-GYP domain-containing protein (c-di-GMP phosphodiesterase class II)
MPTVVKKGIQSLRHFGDLLLEFFYYLGRELRAPTIYLSSGLVGFLFSWMIGSISTMAFVIPFAVQIVSQAMVRFRNRDTDTLLLLPAQREDPAFVMDLKGHIVLATGKTDQLLKQKSVGNIKDLIAADDFSRLINEMDQSCPEPETRSINLYSQPLQNWYKVKFKPVISHCGRLPEKLLVWFSEETSRREAELRQRDLLQYSDSLISSVKLIARDMSTYDHLAAFILNNYAGVFIARMDTQGTLTGYVFKRHSELIRSSPVAIDGNSYAPVFLSRHRTSVISDDIRNYSSKKAFTEKYPFDEQVRSFLGMPIRNFINYHAGDVSIIAFNSIRRLSDQENMFIEVLLNTARAVVALVDLARENEEQFLQKVMGLCAAAEYSDEITGKHILRVNEYSRLLAQKLRCNSDFVENIGRVAALHDIGKVAIPELVKLNSSYTADQRLAMQMHTVYGARIIETMMAYSEKEDPRMVMARNIVLHHHQTFNGKGYPRLKSNGTILESIGEDDADYKNNDPLSGSEIPIEALIVGVADRYDALRSSRPYKPAYSHEKTLAIMAKDDRTRVTGAEWYGEELWRVFEKSQLHFKEIFENMRNRRR